MSELRNEISMINRMREKAKKKVLRFLMVSGCIITMLLAGCGEHECAVCGAETRRETTIARKKIFICDSCYRDYIEIQHLFNESLED